MIGAFISPLDAIYVRVLRSFHAAGANGARATG